MGNRGIFWLFERMFQEIISCLSPRRTIQFWLLFAQNFIKVHGNNTALTWNTGLWNFNHLFCMDFAKFMCFLHKLRPSSCFILNHKSLPVDPGSSFRLPEPYTTLHSLDFQNEGPSHPYFKLQKVSLPHLSSFTKKYGCNISFDVFEILQILKAIRTHLKPFWNGLEILKYCQTCHGVSQRVIQERDNGGKFSETDLIFMSPLFL